MENEQEDPSIDEIIKSIREAIVEKERKKYFASFRSEVHGQGQFDEVFELSKNMLVEREDIPYQLGVWSFDDVAKKMLKKYQAYFKSIRSNDNEKKKTNIA